MSLLDELERIDRTRRRLALHEERARRLWFWPSLRKRWLKRFAERWHEATTRRSRILGLIQADPVLRAELKKRERAVVEAAQARPSVSTRELKKEAAAIISLREVERAARDAYQDCVWYYKSGDWKPHGLDVGEVTGVLDRFKSDMARACRARAARQDLFEKKVAEAHPANADHILERERLLRRAWTEAGLARASEPDGPPAANAFSQWLTARVPGLDQLKSERKLRRQLRR